ncbi:unnamed protein product [Hymenolepis diminuta]|uniref:Vacuolar protein sorting-associated protein VTA1 n=1 Tax=Hymenolepis diminuta TaxID=6216 RepID=A0A0R3SRD1_HYMDI|nr:unnamed protein product [Hymenolepis diminuta]VUZ43390.1 unnamed protein product [Hymenolepis diminuta]
MALAKPPDCLKKYARICKLAQDNEEADPVITYYCRLFVASMGLKGDSKNKDARDFITKLLDYLDAEKKTHTTDSMYTEERVGLQYVESQALDLFTTAFRKDESGDFGNATITGFLNAATLLEVLTLNGETNEELTNARKYAKYKVVYLVDCKKRGVQPVAGPLKEGDASVAPDIAGLREESPPPKEHSPKFSPDLSKQTVKSAESASNYDLKSLDELSTEVCEKTIKAAKFAIGCLQYKDRDGAIKYLQEALNLLTH